MNSLVIFLSNFLYHIIIFYMSLNLNGTSYDVHIIRRVVVCFFLIFFDLNGAPLYVV